MRAKTTVAHRKALTAFQQSLMAVLSGLLLSLPFLEASYYVFAWFAFVPLLFALRGACLWRSYLLGLLSGIAFCVSAGYWVVDFLMLSKGYSVNLSVMWSLIFWLYCAQLHGLIAVLFNWLRLRSTVHEFILFPVVVVSLYATFPMLFPVHLGESQSQFLSAIQAAEFSGVYGVDGIIALSNIVAFSLAGSVLTKNSRNIFTGATCVSFIAIIAWFGYGVFAIERWNFTLGQSDLIRIGIVQPNETPSLEKAKSYPGYSRAYPPEMAMTERLNEAGAELVIWPEAKYKAYVDQRNVSRAYHDQIRNLGTRLVFQDIEHTVAQKNSRSLQYNTALMLGADGSLLGDYQKMKRIPFGEYVPLVSDIPPLRVWVEEFFGKFLNEMAAGSSHQLFSDERFNIIPLICYEVMFPEFVANAVTHAINEITQPPVQSTTKLGLLVGLSSNGWFGDTRQPYQHVNASILRAVENRMPLVHAVNNGPSIAALPSGQVIFTSDYRQAGGYIVDIPEISADDLSFFSQYPKLFLFSIYGILAIIILYSSVCYKLRK